VSSLNSTLRGRAQRAFGSLDANVAVARVRAIVGTTNLPAGAEGELAKTALLKLKEGDDLTPSELAALERMIRLVRPAPIFQEGVPDDFSVPEFTSTFPDWEQFQRVIKGFAYSIGRIDRVTDEHSAGSGFLVSDHHLVTNTHVLDFISYGVRKLSQGQASVRFGWEWQSPGEAPVDILAVTAVHEALDICLLETATVDMSNRRPLSLAETAVDTGTSVVAVGYPFKDSVNNPLFVSQLFGERWGIKRAAPGEVVGVSKDGNAFYHDCSTLGGNSGSPILTMKTAQAVGLHRGGGFLWRNEAIATEALRKFVLPLVN
jgi:S1-C subfamily serine protease